MQRVRINREIRSLIFIEVFVMQVINARYHPNRKQNNEWVKKPEMFES